MCAFERTKKGMKFIMKKIIKVVCIILCIIIILAVFAVIGGYAYLRMKLGKMQYEEISQNATELGISEESQKKTSPIQKYRNIALLGVDSQTDDYDTGYRTDCIMVAKKSNGRRADL